MNVTEIDVRSVRSFADVCGEASRLAADVVATTRSVAGSTGLATGVVGAVQEIVDELRALQRYSDALVDEVAVADLFPLASEGWRRALRAEWEGAVAALWATLTDDVGADALASGRFSLSDALVRLPRQEWLRTAVLPPDCRSFAPDAAYVGGGAVRGPDGELWPIVIPQYTTEHGRVVSIDADLAVDTPSAATLGGADPNWAVVGYRVGVEQFFDGAGVIERAAVGAGIFTGLRVPPTADDEALVNLRFRVGSRPFISGPADSHGGSDPSVAEMSQSLPSSVVASIDGEPGPDPVHTGRINLSGNTLTLLTTGLQGIATALTLNGNTRRAYEVIFERHPDGRRRSRVQTFHLETRADGVYLYANHLFVDDGGVLSEANASYQDGPAMWSADAVVAGNGADELRPRPISGSTIEVQEP